MFAMLASGERVFLSAGHVLTVGVLTLVTAALCVIVRRSRGRPGEARVRRRVCLGIALPTVAAALGKQVLDAYAGGWSLQESLPLHVCDIAAYLTPLALVFAAQRGPREVERAGDRRSPGILQRLYEVSYYWGLGGTLQAVLTPDINDAFPSPAYVRYFIGHGGIIAGTLVMTFGLRLRPRAGSWKWMWWLTLGTALVVMPIDRVLGANYMFLLHPPANPTILDYLAPPPWYFASLAGLGTVMLWVWYSPWWVYDRLRRARFRGQGGAVSRARGERDPRVSRGGDKNAVWSERGEGSQESHGFARRK